VTQKIKLFTPGMLYRFRDLVEKRLVENYPTLRYWQEHNDFPLGKRLGANVRVWTGDELNDWWDSRSTDLKVMSPAARRPGRPRKEIAEATP
jgi:hypothetical protein